MSLETSCAYLDIAEREAFLQCVAPALRPVRIKGSGVRYDRHQIDEWVDARGQLAPARSDEDWLKEV